jgi:hypothetical protein
MGDEMIMMIIKMGKNQFKFLPLLNLPFCFPNLNLNLLDTLVRCMGIGSVSRDFSSPAGLGLLVVRLVVVWPDMPIYDGFLDV